jgi:hypothetical protein
MKVLKQKKNVVFKTTTVKTKKGVDAFFIKKENLMTHTHKIFLIYTKNRQKY